MARHITARWLAAHGAPAPCRQNVVLIVSELLTNAVRHTRESCARQPPPRPRPCPRMPPPGSASSAPCSPAPSPGDARSGPTLVRKE
ncbi:ATP-binding protein [Streptomyces sp. NPDC055056]